MPTCHFCGRRFSNTQAVKAHLQWCPVYQGKPIARPRQLGHAQTLPRRIREEWGDLDMIIEAGDDASWSQEEGAVRQAEAHRPRDEAEQQRQQRRREIIQEIKDEVVDRYWPDPPMPDEAKAQALQAIETTFASLPVDELPRSELVKIATACRTRVYREVERLRSLISWGQDYARRQLEREGVTGWDASRIQSECKQALEQDLDEDSNRGDAQDIVDEILDENLGDEEED